MLALKPSSSFIFVDISIHQYWVPIHQYWGRGRRRGGGEEREREGNEISGGKELVRAVTPSESLKIAFGVSG